MIRQLFIISLVTLFAKSEWTTIKPMNMDDQNNKTESFDAADTTTPKVTGIGDIFFYLDNLKETKEWYAKNLGFEINDENYTFNGWQYKLQ